MLIKKNKDRFEFSQRYDCIVIGGGHSGAEAAHITAKAGLKTMLLTMNLDTIGQMSCNPSIGGIAKGHIVREIDALGGIMGKAIDQTGIHFKMLNRSKGPAVWGPRAQADKKLYQNQIKYILESTPNLDILQDGVEDILIQDSCVKGVLTKRNIEYLSDHIILTTGTFLKGLIHLGEHNVKAGRLGDTRSDQLSFSLEKIGLKLGRIKTGTPPRLHKNSIDFGLMEVQNPDEHPQPFSYEFDYSGKPLPLPQVDCHITHTNHKTHEIIREDLFRSPIYGIKKSISSIGPRYCPSIEDKIVRFSDKERHQLFIEPEGLNTNEVYVNGISTSLPEDTQWKIVRSIRGLENAMIMRPGYAVEYDHIYPTELTPWLETKKIKGLFFAGQINGSTGYEEAAGQGIISGYNVIHKFKKLPPLILRRNESYIGVLIDDLVTKGVDEPYRMFTSRAEYRLFLRQDNADKRLMKYAYRHKLDNGQYKEMLSIYKRFFQIKRKIKKERLNANDVKELNIYDLKISKGDFYESLFRRPQLTQEIIDSIFSILERPSHLNITLDKASKVKLFIEMKYDAYIKREKDKIHRQQNSSLKPIPDNMDYDSINSIKHEARQRLKKIKPSTIGQASRIQGIDPTVIDILLIYLDSSRGSR